ncbi:MAG: acetyl-CoA carboxylase biotin carboxylase subunit [Alphaproteobacteria bacterium]|nr:acetyl-CoA carboxylase biotin carboxylase subunit [Alphaproteobacteria bacterium]
MKQIKKVLIANRGEIALRINRACHDMGIETVAVHSKIDESAMHVRLADAAVCIGPNESAKSYLNQPAILMAALMSGTDAVHPGVGFLAEDAGFAQKVASHGLIFVGPSPEHIRMMGDKVEARAKAVELGLPVVPGSDGVIKTVEEAKRVAAEVGYPVLMKAAGGGGGRGMRVIENAGDVADSMKACQVEALAAFGDDTVFIEKYLSHPRHIEFQILADSHGNVIHLGERDCSIQRRHQKIIEEGPSIVLTPEKRNKIGGIIVDALKKLGYLGAGTLEFLYQDGEFYFIEMNTRLQVEHPVTESITGIDIVRHQLRIAGGESLPYRQEHVRIEKHCIECRINAEDPISLVPRPGKVTDYLAPGGIGVRVDSALYAGYSVPPYYDNLVAKLVITGRTREQCIARTRRALKEYFIGPLQTNIPLHLRILEQPEFISGDYNIHWLERMLERQS